MLTTLIAATLLFTDPTVKNATELRTQAEELTAVYIFCERHLPARSFEDFRPLAMQLGVTDGFILEARRYIARTTPPRGLNTEVCITAVVSQGNALLEALRQRQTR
jgi:hypothetical protein